MLKAQDSANDHQLQRDYLGKAYFLLLKCFVWRASRRRAREADCGKRGGGEERSTHTTLSPFRNPHSRTILHTSVTNILSQGTTPDTTTIKVPRPQSLEQGVRSRCVGMKIPEPAAK